MPSRTFRSFVVHREASGQVTGGVQPLPFSDLPAGNVLIRVRYSSLNYKDAMAATGHPGITKNFPHVPGIDAAGTVVESEDARFQPGDEVIATGHELGVERWGGWAEFVRVPGDWVVPLPDGITLEESMVLGTAGFTAAQSVQALLAHGITPDQGSVIVSGATGGVGSVSVMILAKLGFEVTAVSGKAVMHPWLKEIGARHVVGREELQEEQPRPLLKGKYAAGIDTVGGPTLTTMLKKVSYRGCVTCCGVAGGAEMNGTVFPFILRGITLSGIDSAWCPDDLRVNYWKLLASEWKPDSLASVKRLTSLESIDRYVDAILHGKNVGRVVLDLGERTSPE
ncbi:MAG: YhdH/YhfP family quinone oxidoreductase [Planctomycetaceae bacterium]|nr:YhdH/YhfP family quinone oxidoreductase [Planctomycetaceae bacterium]